MYETDDVPTDSDQVRKHTPGGGVKPGSHPIEPNAPEEFGLVQAWWGGGKGKTTAAMGMGFRAAGHGYRVHMIQFMKAGADSVDAVRGEYNAIEAVPGFSYENLGHYGWHGLRDGSEDDSHQAEARAGYDRTRELIEAAGNADLTEPLPLNGAPEAGMHLLILDEVLYAADRGLIDSEEVIALTEEKPERLELVMTCSHNRPDYLSDHADLVTNVRKEKHPIDAGQRARKGTEF